MTRVLFVCIGNSCRSQMAEAFANALGQGRVTAWSAGASPLGWIAPYTTLAMQEKGISLDGQWSKRLQDVPAGEMDVVVVMGFDVPCLLPRTFKGRRLEWEIPDPFGAPLDSYRQTRDLIEERVRELVGELAPPGPPGASC